MDKNSSDYRYLEKLEFRPELRKTWLNFFVTNFRVVILMIILITMWGVYAYSALPRESNPEVKIPMAVVVTTYPGVGPADMEELVTKKIETGVSSVRGIKTITSRSSNSLSSIVVEFEASEDLEDSIRRLRDEVNSTQSELPSDANDSTVSEVSVDDTPIWTVAITGPYDGFTLRSLSEEIQDEIEKLPGVREVNISGGDEREFEIAYDPEKLVSYNLSLDQVNRAVSATNLTVPGGNFEGEKFNYPIKVDARFFDAQRLGNIPVAHTNDGGIVYLKDIATVQEKAIEKTVYSRLSIDGGHPKDAVTLSIVKRTGGSVIDTVDDARKIIEEKIASFPSGVVYDVTFDQAKFIRQDFEQLSHDFLLTLALVFGILLLIVGLKEAFVAGLAIPLVFFVSFGVMLMTGISLNFLSIFSLLLSLGLLVDDAIVVVSATKQYLKTGKFTPEEAVLLVLNDFKVVLTTTTLTTVWAFLPLLFASGIIGQFIRSIPITVSVTLISSLFIALMINHPLAAVLERIRLTRNLLIFYVLGMIGVAVYAFSLGNVWGYAISAIFVLAILTVVWWFARGGKKVLKRNSELVEMEWEDEELIKKKLKSQGNHEKASFSSRLMHGILNFNRVIPIYEKYLRAMMVTRKRRIAVLVVTFFLFVGAVALPAVGIVPSEFFPPSDGETIFIDVEGPIGLRLDETSKLASKVEEKLLKYPEIVNFSTVIGSTGLNSQSPGTSSHIASITVTLTDMDEREIKAYDLATKIREDMADIKEGRVTVEAQAGGPPTGAAFEARIIGEDLQVLDRIAGDLRGVLTSIPGVVNADISLKNAPADYTFVLDPERMEFYGLNAAYVGGILRTAVSGNEVSTVIRENKEIDIVARFDKSKIPTLSAIQNIQILNVQGQPVFLRDVAKIELNPSVNTITRIDQKRAVVLSAGVEGETRPNEVLAEFQKKTAESYQLPSGYSIEYGGENEENQESVLSIIRAMVIAGLLIISTLIIQFNSFKKSLIVLVTIPLALIGVFYGMALIGVSLSFPGLIGILALFGIVVKNAIILVDKINLNLKSGIEFDESIIDAGKSRLEAIFITSICTIFGIIPVTLSNEIWTALGSAIIFGLMLSSFFTLFIVPVLFKTLVKEKRLNRDSLD